jgi:hypothetical protein
LLAGTAAAVVWASRRDLGVFDEREEYQPDTLNRFEHWWATPVQGWVVRTERDRQAVRPRSRQFRLISRRGPPRPPVARYDGILCRGVLNDFVNDDAPLSVCAALAGALRRPGVLILDVREWEATRDRKQPEPVFRKSVLTDRAGSRSRAPPNSIRSASSFFCQKRTLWSTTLENIRATIAS